MFSGEFAKGKKRSSKAINQVKSKEPHEPFDLGFGVDRLGPVAVIRDQSCRKDRPYPVPTPVKRELPHCLQRAHPIYRPAAAVDSQDRKRSGFS